MTYYRVVNHRGGPRYLHTDEECSRVQKSKAVRPVERSQFPDAEICPACSGEIEWTSDQDHSHYHALLEASNE